MAELEPNPVLPLMRWAPLRWFLALVTGAVLLESVAIVNGGPIYYPDTTAYLVDAERLFHLQAPWALRPIFYGLFVWVLHWRANFAPALLAQGLVTSAMIALLLRVCGVLPKPLGFVGVMGALVGLTPVSWYASHLMPDLFVAVLVLAVFVLGCCREELTRWEAAGVFCLLAASVSFHVTAIPLIAALCAVVLVARLAWHWRAAAPLPLAASGAIAIASTLAINAIIFQRISLAPNHPPSVLARLIADGPARDFLAASCPQKRLTLCRYQDRLAGSEDAFTWGLLPQLPYADGKAVKAEAASVILGTIQREPLPVLEHGLRNAARQLITIGSETQVSPSEWTEYLGDGSPLAQALAHSRQRAGFWDRPALDGINRVQGWVAAASAVGGLVVLAACLRARQYRLAALLTLVGVALLVNAVVCGALDGVFGRYEGRLIWLLPLAVGTAAAGLRRAARQPVDGRYPTPGSVTRSAPAAPSL